MELRGRLRSYDLYSRLRRLTCLSDFEEISVKLHKSLWLCQVPGALQACVRQFFAAGAAYWCRFWYWCREMEQGNKSPACFAIQLALSGAKGPDSFSSRRAWTEGTCSPVFTHVWGCLERFCLTEQSLCQCSSIKLGQDGTLLAQQVDCSGLTETRATASADPLTAS